MRGAPRSCGVDCCAFERGRDPASAPAPPYPGHLHEGPRDSGTLRHLAQLHEIVARHRHQLTCPEMPALSKQTVHYGPVIQAADANHAWQLVAEPSVNDQRVYPTAGAGRTWHRLALP